MNARILCLSLVLTACGSDAAMTRHEVCERLAAATCERRVVCEPTVAQAGCEMVSMDRCCPDGVCDEPVVATEARMDACESAVTQMSCSDLADGSPPAACSDLTAPLPDDAGSGSGGGSGSGSGGPGVLEVNWSIIAGGVSVSCTDFKATSVHIVATSPGGMKFTSDFDCDLMSALSNLPDGPYSIVAQAVGPGGVVQQTPAQTVVVSGGASVTFTFSISTNLGQYCVQLATALCNACSPTDTTCKQDAVNECCATDGICNNAATVNSSQWSSCLSQVQTGNYCTQLPATCSNAIDVY